MAQSGTTGISVTTKFFFLAFLLLLFPPTIVVDGDAEKARWGEKFIPTTPGDHTVEVFFRYMFLKRAGYASVSVAVGEGETTQVTYKAPWIVFLPGKIFTSKTTTRR